MKKSIDKLAKKIIAAKEEYHKKLDVELQLNTQKFISRFEHGETLQDLYEEAFGTVIEATQRVLHYKPTYQQILASLLLEAGYITNVDVYEDKPLIMLLYIYLHSLTKGTVHVVCENEMIAKMNVEKSGKVLEWLGVTVGLNATHLSSKQRQEVYQCDVVYSSQQLIIEDYLKDGHIHHLKEKRQIKRSTLLLDNPSIILLNEPQVLMIHEQPQALITPYHYYHLYQKIACIVDDALAAKEFEHILGQEVSTITTPKQNTPLVHEDLLYLTKNDKYNAILIDVKQRCENGQPVLLGTINEKQTKLMASLCDQIHLPYQILSNPLGAQIIQKMSEPHMVTIATAQSLKGVTIPMKEEALDMGGLYVVGINRSMNRRNDEEFLSHSNECQFYVSLEDQLLRNINTTSLKKQLNEHPLSHPSITSYIKDIQLSQQTLKYKQLQLSSDFSTFEQQRRAFLDSRNYLLKQKELTTWLSQAIHKAISTIVKEHSKRQMIDYDSLYEAFKYYTTYELQLPTKCNSQQLIEAIHTALMKQYQVIVEKKKVDSMKVEKQIFLESYDASYAKHIQSILNLKDNYLQYDETQYTIQANKSFEEMKNTIAKNVLYQCFHMNEAGN